MGTQAHGIICVVVMGCLGGIVRGQATMPGTVPATYPVVIQPWPYPEDGRPRDSWMRPGDVDLSVGAEGMTLDTHDHDTLGFLTIGGGYHFTGRVSGHLQAALSGGELGSFTYEDSELEDAYLKLRAVGGFASVRYEFLRARGVGLFAEGGLGYLSGHRGFLPGRAEEAWEQAVGAGVVCRVAANVYLAGGVRYVRLSEEFLGGSRERSANGVGYWVSLSLRL